MARSNGSSCSCRHLNAETGLPVKGSGTLADPYAHESARFINIKDPNKNNVVLKINENGCVVLPRTIRRVLLARTGQELQPNAAGHIPWPDFMKSFNVEATSVNYGSVTANQTKITGTISSSAQQLTITSIGTTESDTSLLFSDGGIGTVLQGDMTFQEGPSALSTPQLRTASNSINEINFPFTTVGVGAGPSVELWPSTKVLAINRNCTAICHVKFSLEFGPEPAGGHQSFANALFDIIDANDTVVHKGYFTPELPRIKTYSYFFPLEFTGPSSTSGNGKVDFRVFSQSALPTSSSMTIRDILVSYTLI